MKNLESNFRKKVYYASVCCCIFLINSLNAQDLLTQPNTQKSFQKKSENLIAQKINVLKTSTSFNEVNLFSLNSIQQKSDLSQYIDGQVILTLEKDKIKSLLNNKSRNKQVTLRLPVKKGYSIELELTESKVVTDDFKIKTASGKTIKYNQSNALFYRGIVKGDPSSAAAISIFKGQIQGVISDNHGNYVLGSLDNNKNNSTDYILYNDKKLKIKSEIFCDTEDTPLSYSTKRINTPINKAAGDIIEVYVETDFQTFIDHNRDPEAVEEYVIALMNETAVIYDNEEINIALSELMIWDEIDPYANLFGTYAIRNAFGDHLKNNYNGRLAHLISTRGSSTGVAGRAWIDQLCAEYHREIVNGIVEHQGPYAVTMGVANTIVPFPTYSRTVKVFAHEMGHTFGSRHTHWCGWDGGPIDGCSGSVEVDDNGNTCAIGGRPQNGGTIMSYCDRTGQPGVNFNEGFGEQPGDFIRERVAAICLTTPPNNLALNKPATQSSPGDWGAVAERANDGNTNGNFFSGSVSHTGKDSKPWWEVDLTINASIREIKIFNRTGKTSDRLSDFTVSIIDRDGKTTFSESFVNYPNPSLTISTENTIGKIVRVQLNGTDYLSLAEVEVYGNEVDLPEPPGIYTIYPEADALVKSGRNSNKNYGTLENLNIKLNATAGNENKSFIRFDLSDVPSTETINSAIIRLYALESGSNSANSDYRVNWVREDNWAEVGTNSITWSNTPEISTAEFDFKGSASNEYLEVNVTEWVRWEKLLIANLGNKISLSFSAITGDNQGKMKLASREHPIEEFRPVLLINQDASSSSSEDLDITSVSSFNKETANISIFPNPANNHINVGIDNLDLDGNIEIKVYNLLGTIVYNKQYASTAGTPFKTTLPLNNVKQGMYLMNVTVNDNPYSTLRFIKN